MSDTITVKFKGFNTINMNVKTEPKLKGKITFSDNCLRQILSYLDRERNEIILSHNNEEYKIIGVKGRFALKVIGWRDVSALENNELFFDEIKASATGGCCIEFFDVGSESIILFIIVILFIVLLYPFYRFIAKPFVHTILKNIFGDKIISLGYEHNIYVKIDTSDPNYFSKLESFLYYLKENLWAPISPPCIMEKVLPVKEFRLNWILNKRISNGRNNIYASVTLGIAFLVYLLAFKILEFYFTLFNVLFGFLVSPVVLLILSMLSIIMFSIGFYMISSAYNLYKEINNNQQ